MSFANHEERILYYITNAEPGGDVNLLDRVASPNIVRHDAELGDLGPLPTLKQAYLGWNQAFPDGKTTIGSPIVDGDRVAVRFEYTATHAGPLSLPGSTTPVQPSNAKITMVGTLTVHFAKDLIEEIWADWNSLTVMTDLELAKSVL